MADVRILIVEDQNIVALDIRNRLRSLGYAVPGIVSSGKDAIRTTAELRPDLVLMDIKLKGEMDGVEAAEQIRTQFDIPVIYLTAYADEATLQRAKITEPFGYVVKPFEERELNATIEMALSRHRLEQRLRASEERFRSLVQRLTDIVWIIDEDTTIQYETPSCSRILGYEPGFLIGKIGTEFVHPEDSSLVTNDLDEVLRRENRFIPTEFRFRHADGHWVQLEAIANNMLDHPGIQGVVVTARDITERKRAEEAVRRSERLLHSLIESLPQNIYSKDLEGRFTFANRHYCATEGKPLADILGKTDFDLHPPESAEKYRNDDRRVIETGQLFETVEEHRPVDRESSYVHVIKTPLYDAAGQVSGTLGIFWDVTEQRRAEQLLQALNRAAVAMAQAFTPDDIFISVAGEFKKLGFSCMVLSTDESHDRLFNTYLSIDTALVKAAERLVGLKRAGFSFPIKDVDVYKQVVWEREAVFIDDTEEVIRQLLPRPAKGFARQLVRVLDSWKAVASPLIVDDKVIGVLSVQSADLTETDVPAVTAFAHQMAAAWRKAQLLQELEQSLQELQRTQDQLVQAQKMEAIGRLAGGVAHDFNNLLTVVQVSSQLLMQQLHPQDPLHEHVLQIQEAGERAAGLTRQLLRFSRREIVEPRVVNLNTVIADLSRMLQRIIEEDVELVTTMAGDLWPVRMDPAQIEQVIVNLVVNARDAMPQGGRLAIETGNVVLDEQSAARYVDAEPGEYVLLTISDTGVGMDEKVKTHIFEPFFTTKEQGQGTGLGLSTVYGIVRQNGGHIEVESEMGQGTTFKIYLPRSEQAQALYQAPPRDASPDLTGGSETILVVEDERAVRELAVRVLKTQGYHVLEAENGPEALVISQRHEEPVHLLLTDVVMPAMSGRELAEQLQSQRREMRVLYMSGYNDDVIETHGVLDEGVAFLPKPFTLEVLSRKVRAVLDTPR